MVCEDERAHWLPFGLIVDTKTNRKELRSKEVVWLSGDS